MDMTINSFKVKGTELIEVTIGGRVFVPKGGK